jgi:hypothetical protein
MCNGKSLDFEQLPRDDLIVEILRYVVRHPSAKDTIKGIEKWWLSGSAGRGGKLSKEETLNLLVAKGWLLARCSPQSETIYSLNESRLSEITAFLKEEP